ncbi:hypothetical protein [Desulfosarcina widdelii]|uniref:hypothetical protein n=1 Tax=Desulfosarcina widdelii TaxID=947919 RepID=UPI00147970F7|nr:hypothetical protein [Desulfosarcina widdelii]
MSQHPMAFSFSKPHVWWIAFTAKRLAFKIQQHRLPASLWATATTITSGNMHACHDFGIQRDAEKVSIFLPHRWFDGNGHPLPS